MNGDFTIFALQGDWTIVGRIRSDPWDFPNPNGQFFILEDASIICVWGTDAGLGQLTDGPREQTELSPLQGNVYINPALVVWSYKPAVWPSKKEESLVRGTFPPRTLLTLWGPRGRSELAMGQPVTDPRTDPTHRQFVLDDSIVINNWHKFGIEAVLAGPLAGLQRHTYPHLNIPRSRVIWTAELTSWPSPNSSR